MSLRNNRIAAVAVGAAVLVGFSSVGAVAAGYIGSDGIRDNSIRSVDIRDGQVQKADVAAGAVGGSEIANAAIGERELTAGVVAKLNTVGEQGEQGPKGDKGDPGDPASDAFGKLAVVESSTNMTPIAKIGGTYSTNATTLFTFDLPEAGTYLVNAYGYFDRLDAGVTDNGYEEPTTDTYLQLSLRGANVQAGTYFTGAISPSGRIEATVSGAQVVTVDAPTTITVRAFGYNEDRSGFGGAPNSATPQFSAFANVSAVKVG